MTTARKENTRKMQENAASDGSSEVDFPFLADGCGSTVNWEMHPRASESGRHRRRDPRPRLPGRSGGLRPAQVPPRSPAPPWQLARPRRHGSVRLRRPKGRRLGRGRRRLPALRHPPRCCPPAAAPTPRGSRSLLTPPGRPGPHPPPTRTGAPRAQPWSRGGHNSKGRHGPGRQKVSDHRNDSG